MGLEGITQNTKVRGNTRPEPPPLGICAVRACRVRRPCSTASLRFACLRQNAYGRWHGGHILQINASGILKIFLLQFSRED